MWLDFGMCGRQEGGWTVALKVMHRGKGMLPFNASLYQETSLSASATINSVTTATQVLVRHEICLFCCCC